VVADATKATGYGFQVELSYRAHRRGATIVEVPITFNDRVRGESKMSWHIIGEAMSLVTWWGLRDRLLARRRNRPEPVPARTAASSDSPDSPGSPTSSTSQPAPPASATPTDGAEPSPGARASVPSAEPAPEP
jgi:hypothetical protein